MIKFLVRRKWTFVILAALMTFGRDASHALAQYYDDYCYDSGNSGYRQPLDDRGGFCNGVTFSPIDASYDDKTKLADQK